MSSQAKVGSMDVQTVELIRKHPFFTGIEQEELTDILQFFKILHLKQGETIIEEGIKSTNELYLILQGNLEVIRKTNSAPQIANEIDDPGQFIIARLAAGDLVGERSFIEGIKRSASIKCITQSIVLTLDPLESIQLEINHPKAFGQMMKNLAGYVAGRLEKTTSNEVRSLKTELHNSRLNSKAHLFFSYVIGLLCVYNLTISKISQLSIDANRASIISAIIIIAFGLGLVLMIRQSKIPIYVLGLSSKNLRPALKESLLWTAIIILGMILAKLALVQWVSKYQHLTLFDFNVSQQYLGLNFILYGLHSPIQEFIARGVLQGSLQHFFSGKNVTFRAIIVSNALFSATHVHLMEGMLGIIVFIPGLFWGWLYSRNSNLIGVSISHLLIGWTGLFFLNLERLF